MGENLSDKILVLITKIDDSLTGFDKSAIESSMKPLTVLRNDLQKTIHENFKEPVERCINKLRKNEDMSPLEMQMIEKWLVGDAEYYIKLENNLMDWLTECKRLCTLIISYYSDEAIDMDDDKLFDLGAYLTDLQGTLDDILRFYQSMNRVDQFKRFVGNKPLTYGTKKLLADLMERRLNE
ncbi:MAG: hypothetical protein NT038_03820 [Euryarchaeota archaeon]|nr:hypothetical protein [Euryarchaeota archaeon]